MPTDPPAAPSPSSHLRVLRDALAAPRRYLAPWYLAYLLLGLVTAGMVPVLLPLLVVAVSHQLDAVAYVMGGYNIGLFSAPLWGLLAERGRLYRAVFFGGFAVTALAIAAMPLLAGVVAWLSCAVVMGMGTAAAATVASLLVVDFAPRAEWEPRIGWLQSFNGAGQMAGLLLVGLFSHGLFATGLWVAAALLIPALVLGRRGLPTAAGARERAPGTPHPLRTHLDIRALAAFPRASLAGGILRASHHLHLAGLRALPALAGTAFGRFLLSWFALSLGVAAFFAYFPLMMQTSYGVSPAATSLTYALAAGIGIGLFVLASRWAERYGPGPVYVAGVALRSAGFALLLVLFALPAPDRGAAALAAFSAIVLAWPVLSVAGTGLAAHLAPMSEGAAMGLFNAATALATVLGIFLSGPLVRGLGYGAIPAMAVLGLAGAFLLRPTSARGAATADSGTPA